MKHWLFMVMEDGYPGLWKRSVEEGYGAQHYPESYPVKSSRTRNIRLLEQMQAGDGVVATFGAHRLAGYGFLTSGLRHSQPPLGIWAADRRHRLEFGERFSCEWTALPAGIGHVDAKSLQVASGLPSYVCVCAISKRDFAAMQKVLDDSIAT